MLPVKTEGSALTVRQEKYLAQKQVILNAPAVQSKLTSIELSIAQAGLEVPIRHLPDEQLLPKVGTAAKFICRDVGIKSWDNTELMKYDAARFFTHLKSYFSDLSLKEIKMAFELAAVGELDEWLPRDKNGNPDCEHYQSFSLQYYSKILKAYRAKKGKTWHKARKALPAPEMVITEEQRQENRRHCLQDIYDAFNRYKDHGEPPRFSLEIFINIFIEQGVIQEKPVPSDSMVERAYRKLLGSEPALNVKRALISSFHKNNPDGLIIAEAQRVANNQAIEAIFEKLVKDNQEIETLIK